MFYFLLLQRILTLIDTNSKQLTYKIYDFVFGESQNNFNMKSVIWNCCIQMCREPHIPSKTQIRTVHIFSPCFHQNDRKQLLISSSLLCDQCGRSYAHASSLLNHKNTHTIGIYHCAVCLKTYSNLLALKNHRRIHSEIRRHRCPECGKAFRVSSQLNSHRRVHLKERELTLRTCISNSISEVSNMLEQIVEIPPKSHVCDQCGRGYRHAGSLQNHKNIHKTGAYFCSSCQKEFSNLMALKTHRRIHTEVKRHRCSDCGKAFRAPSQLIVHRRIHTQEKPFSCQQCTKRFSSKSNLRHHMKLHWSGSAPSTKRFLEVCSTFTFSGKPVIGGGAKSHVCDQCGRAYRHASSLLNHKTIHKTGAYFCTSCQKEFHNLNALKNHQRIHTETKRYECPECGKSFRVSTQLIIHRRIHTKEKPFSCQQCDKRFSSKSNLRHHMKLHWGSSVRPVRTNVSVAATRTPIILIRLQFCALGSKIASK
ncbi:unnamed protein product [Oncorhynchus mykiss]|uniref:C2H2-type domain-containing protein n=1 Tax=Oncorhynchus mykiss TaxID=8022 RepID=A0A060WLW9_ONCMY|nr:unnamed protein product [Oncorhynchus mykiss]